MVRAKYQAVLDLGEQLNIQDGDVSEENGVLKVKGTAATQYEKNLLWDAIKVAGGDNPSDIMADIKVADESVYARHTVASGETFTENMWETPNLTNVIRIFARNLPMLDSWEAKMQWLSTPLRQLGHFRRRNSKFPSHPEEAGLCLSRNLLVQRSISRGFARLFFPRDLRKFFFLLVLPSPGPYDSPSVVLRFVKRGTSGSSSGGGKRKGDIPIQILTRQKLLYLCLM